MNNPGINYHHSYHAGNFADVFKHVVLILLLQSLLKKEKPFCYLDIHAGAGLYDLQQSAAQKTREYMNGLAPLLREKARPEIIKLYLDIIAAHNPHTPAHVLPRYYPGSPCIAKHFLRSQDRMILNDLLPENTEALHVLWQKDKQVLVQQMDAYQTLKALLPPKEKRGLVLIDPPYEHTQEYSHILNAIKNALARWATGIYAIWYPIKDKAITNKFLQQLKTQMQEELLVAEIMLYADDVKMALNGCGMAIINPPWQLDTKLNELLPWLWQTLAPEQKGGYQIK